MSSVGSRALLLAILVVSACGGGPAPAGSPAAAPAKAFQGTKTFTVAFPPIGASSVPLLAAIDSLRSQGFTIQTPEIAESELSVQGVVKGDFAFSSGTTSAVLIAVQKGGGAKILMDRVSNEWTIYATKEVTSCAGLDGKKVAISSEGSVSATMLRIWMNKTCPGTKPTYIRIPGSGARFKALLAGQIDATPLELEDATALEAEGGDRFKLLTSFSQTLPDVHPTTVYGNAEFVAKNPDTVRALVKALLEQHRKIAGDPKYLAEITVKFYPGAEKKTLDLSAKKYVSLKMFDVNGGLTEESLKGTLDFFVGGEAVKPGLTVKDFADLSFLTAVLGEIGRN